LRITVAYDGTDYHGWQVQPGLPTIQGVLESVLSGIEGEPVHVTGSGRTDAGVHALAQVAAFDLKNPIPYANLRRALNRLLPTAIRVLDVNGAPPGFHPRRAAIAKTYEYRIWRAEVCPPFTRFYVHHHPYPLDVARMRDIAPLIEGEHDFSAFAAADDKDALGQSKVRIIYRSELIPNGEVLLYRVRGNGFLKHMVRLVVGTLLEVGKGNLGREDLQAMLEPHCSRKAGPAVPARGLFLVSVEYGTHAGEEATEREPRPVDA
jgi:tRNA pseudouridine38-40 synthase